jgi:NEDD4-binding protein 2
MKTLFLVRGVPGSGKSTLVEALAAWDISADDYHTDADGNYNWKPENVKKAHQWCQREVESAMQSNDIAHISVHNTFTQEWEMKPYFDLAKQYGYRVTTLIVENRHGSTNVHNVPEETIQKMKDRFEIIL